MVRILLSGFLFLALITTAADIFAFQGGRGGGSQTPAGRSGQAGSAPAIPNEWMPLVKWRSIGPANMGGRITALSVYEANSRIWYAATASGGLLKTENDGQTFEHQFTGEATVSIGDVQVFRKDPNIVWVGTGEANPRNSVSWGDGVYKSVDGGKTWKNTGLKNSFQIGQIALHPENPDIAYVGALGRLWGPNEERGLFKTIDGGKTWEKVLYINDVTGVIDVCMHPKDPEILLVATYERLRDGFDGNDPVKKYGEGAAIYRTADGGKNFTKITDGLPTCKLGRIGIDWFQKNGEFVYAVIESEKIATLPENAGYAGLSGEDAESAGAKLTDVVAGSPAAKAGLKIDDIVIEVNGKFVGTYAEMLAELRKNVADDEVRLQIVRERKPEEIKLTLGKRPAGRNREGRTRSSEFTGTLGGQAANMQGQQGIEAEHEYGGIYMSRDAGLSWSRINTLNERPMYYSEIRVDPSNRDYLYKLGTSLWRSKDGGETFTGDGGNNVHPDHHALWIDPKDGQHMILGNDGGLYVTHNRMDSWEHLNNVAIGQFYHVGIDTNVDYKVYGGLQDNGSWGGPVQIGGQGARNTDWFSVGGGDGFVTLVDPTDPDQVYYESQNGAMGRINFRTGERGGIRPEAPRGTQYRFNWETPFILSPHNSRIHYSAGNYVFRSLSKGDRTQAISPEITNTNKGTGSAISESPLTPGVIYVGTTDGAVWVTRDGGQKWDEIFVRKVADSEKAAPEESESGEGGGGESGGESAPPAESTESAKGGKASEGEEAPPATGQTSEEKKAEKSDKTAEPPAEKKESEADEKKKAAAAKRADDAAKREKRRADAEKKRAENEAKRQQAQKEKEEAEKLKKEKSVEPQRPAGEDLKMEEGAKAEIPAALQALTGEWEGSLELDRLPEDQRWIRMELRINDDGVLAGTFVTPRSETVLSGFSLDESSGEIAWSGKNSVQDVTFRGKVVGEGRIEGIVDMGSLQVPFVAERKKELPVSAVGPRRDMTSNTTQVSGPRYQLASIRVPVSEDPVTGLWNAEMRAEELPEGQGKFELELKLGDDNTVTGTASSPMGTLDVLDGAWSPDTGKLTFSISSEESGLDAQLEATITGETMKGKIVIAGGQMQIEFDAVRATPDPAEKVAESEPVPEKKPEAGGKDAEAPQEPAGEEKKQEKQEAEPQEAKDAGQPAAIQDEPAVAAEGDLVTGTWEGKFISDFMRGDRGNFTLQLKKAADGKVSGWFQTSQSQGEIVDGKIGDDGKSIDFVVAGGRADMEFSGTIEDDRLTGSVDLAGRDVSFDFEARRTKKEYSPREAPAGESTAATEPASAGDRKKLEELVPGPRWVSSIEASRFSASRVYLTLDGHRSNDDEPYVFVSEDYGKSWSSLRANLPTSAGTVWVIREDLENPDLLFLGCEMSAWVSIDRGKSWTRFAGGLPTVAVHDFALHRHSGDIVAGTHGRSLWVADIMPLRKLRTADLALEAVLLEPTDVIRWRNNRRFADIGNNAFRGEAPPQVARIYYHIGRRLSQPARVEIRDVTGNLIRSYEGESETGLKMVEWDLRREQRTPAQGGGQGQRFGGGGFGGRGGGGVPAGQYVVILYAGDQQYRKVLEIKLDPNLPDDAVSEDEWFGEEEFWQESRDDQ
jgi:photosystem II stability/assembly factor-like uncharacterized protein